MLKFLLVCKMLFPVYTCLYFTCRPITFSQMHSNAVLELLWFVCDAAISVLAIVAVSLVGLAVCLTIICCGIFCLRRSNGISFMV